MRNSKTRATAQAVLIERYKKLGTWAIVSEDLGGINRGMLCAVANGHKKASRPLIDKLNTAYGLHLHYETKIEVDPLPCGCPPTGKRCKVHQPPTKYTKHPVMRLSKILRVLQSPYKDS